MAEAEDQAGVQHGGGGEEALGEEWEAWEAWEAWVEWEEWEVLNIDYMFPTIDNMTSLQAPVGWTWPQ